MGDLLSFSKKFGSCGIHTIKLKKLLELRSPKHEAKNIITIFPPVEIGSITLRLPKILSFIYAGMNYHAEHHLLPSMPFYNLEASSNVLKKTIRILPQIGVPILAINFFF